MNERDLPDRLMTEKEAARITGFSHRTLQKWRCYGGGPPFRKVGRSIRYLLSELLAWIEADPRRNTAEAGAPG